MATLADPNKHDTGASEAETSTGNEDRGVLFDTLGEVEELASGASEGMERFPPDPDEVLELASSVYDGLSEEEVEDVETTMFEGRSWRGEREASGNDG